MLVHDPALSTFLFMRQEIFLVKSPTIVESECEILPIPMKSRQTLAQYVNQVMLDNGEKPKDIESRAKRAGHQISDSAIGNIILEKVDNPGIKTLHALALGLGRPVEEVIAAALGEMPKESLGYTESEMADFWQVLNRLPAAEQKYYKRTLQMLKRDMLRP